ncbi:MAG: 5'-methylthioadenosine phosphorylase, partial [Candidatus Thermoplasmatota archaeon]
MATAVLGLIAGSGLRAFSILKGEKPMHVDTPYGPPADGPRMGRVGSLTVALLARHGRDHRVPPHRINHRANLWALKKLGVTRILATSSTGSLKPSIRPGGFVVPHDFV